MALKAVTSHKCVSNRPYLVSDGKAFQQANIMGGLIHLGYKRWYFFPKYRYVVPFFTFEGIQGSCTEPDDRGYEKDPCFIRGTTFGQLSLTLHSPLIL